MCNVMVSLDPLPCITPQVLHRRSPVAATNIVLKPEYQAFLGEKGEERSQKGRKQRVRNA